MFVKSIFDPINKLEGPVSVNLMIPNNPSFPTIILFGDVHIGNQKCKDSFSLYTGRNSFWEMGVHLFSLP